MWFGRENAENLVEIDVIDYILYYIPEDWEGGMFSMMKHDIVT